MRLALKAFLIAVLLSTATNPAAAGRIRIAEAAPPDVKMLVVLVALEHAKARGVDYELTALRSDEIALQAMLSGQVDMVVGSLAYAAIQTVKAPYRHLMQLRPVMYFPVVPTDEVNSWSDLNGKTIALHARGSGTEVMAHVLEDAHKFKFGRLIFAPGSIVRANGLINGTFKAAMLDISGVQYIERRSPGRFKVMPIPDLPASEGALFSSQAFINANRGGIQIIVEEMLKVFRASDADATYIARERVRLNILPELDRESVAEIEPFYRTAAQRHLLPENGGGVDAALADLQFYCKTGTLTGNCSDLKVEDYWDLSVLDAALTSIGVAPPRSKSAH